MGIRVPEDRLPILKGKIAEIPLTQGKVAIIDAQDVPLVSQYRWSAKGSAYRWYAVAEQGGGRKLYLHNLLMQPPKGMIVDHINLNSLDNRRCNLRLCTRQQNERNKQPRSTSKNPFKGVSRVGMEWAAKGRGANGKYQVIGLYQSAIHAAIAHDIWVLQNGDEFDFTNFPRNAVMLLGCTPQDRWLDTIRKHNIVPTQAERLRWEMDKEA